MYTYTRKAQYHETDKMGIIHHSNYIKWMEEARVEYMEHLGYGYDKAEENNISSPVVSLSINYKRTVHFNDIVEIKVFVTRYSSVVQEVSYEFFNKSRNELSAKATSKHCYINNQGSVVNLKKTLPELDALFTSEFLKYKESLDTK